MFSKQTFSVLLLFPLVAFAADKTTTNDTLNSLEKKASYAVGADIAAKIKATNVRFDAEALSQGTNTGHDIRNKLFSHFGNKFWPSMFLPFLKKSVINGGRILVFRIGGLIC